jgi:hypothetical protein
VRDGRRLTEDDLDMLAEGAEGLGPPTGLVPGGKSPPGDGAHSPRFTIRLDKAAAKAVRNRARREGKLLRQMVAAHVAD